MTLVAILSGAGLIGVIHFFSQSLFVLPAEANLSVMLHDGAQAIVEGGPLAGGLRSARSLSIMDDNRIAFTDKDGRDVEFEIKYSKLKVSIDGGGFKKVPYYVDEEVIFSGEEGVVFSYFDQNENPVSDPDKVKRIKVALEARQKGRGPVKINTAISVKTFSP